MPRPRDILNDRFLKSAPPGEHKDGAGLYCVIKGPDSKHWEYKYQWDGKTRDKRLGPFPLVGVAAARAARDRFKLQLLAGTCPVDERKKEKAVKAGQKTFGQCFEQLMATKQHQSQSTLRSWRCRITKYCSHLFKKLVNEITREDILAILEPVWNVYPVAAEEVRERMHAIFDVAIEDRLIEYNPAERRRFRTTLADRKRHTVTHYPGIPWQDIPEFLRKLADWGIPKGPYEHRECRRSRVAAIEVIILTAVRNGSARNARVGEFNLETKIWIIPAEHMKMRKEFKVPLSDRVVEVVRPLLEDKPADSLVFRGLIDDNPLCMNSLLEPIKEIGADPKLTTHGFRSSFRNWCGEFRPHVDDVVAEACLAHAKEKVEGSYFTSSLLERRRDALDRWARFCLSQEGEKVVNLFG